MELVEARQDGISLTRLDAYCAYLLLSSLRPLLLSLLFSLFVSLLPLWF